jgi:hypothetical protein
VSGLPDLAILVGGTVLAILAVLALVLGVTHRAVWLSDRFRIVERLKRRRRRRTPARTASSFKVSRPATPRRRFVHAPDAYATTPYAQQRLERYLREGIPTVTKPPSDPPAN